MPFKSLAVTAFVFLFSFAGFAHAQANGPYKVQKIQLVGGDGGFDYVTADPDGRNLYVARSGPAGHIGVFNLDTLAQVGDLPGVSGHGAAVDTATGHGFATSKPVTMFDARTFAILKKIEVEGNPDGYLNDPYNHRFYILSHVGAQRHGARRQGRLDSGHHRPRRRAGAGRHRRPRQNLRRP